VNVVPQIKLKKARNKGLTHSWRLTLCSESRRAGDVSDSCKECEEVVTLIDGQLYFAPGLLMKDLDLDDHESVLSAFEQRVKGLFLSPIRALERRENGEEGALFAGALLVAALIESVARVETGSDAQGTLIKQWLETHIEAFQGTVVFAPGRTARPETKTLADVFEYRFRNGLAHSGYVASLGRLSRSIDGPVTVAADIVIVNPFSLADAVEQCIDIFAADLRAGRRDIRRFAYHVAEQFREEVNRARAEAAA
jgi:hypothetical protein